MKKSIKLLLAEDDENLGTVLKEYLTTKGFDTDLFADGEAAYEAFLKEKYSFCILDIMMPKLDGFALAFDIKSINKDVPIIFLSAKNMKGDVIEGFKLGADDYITKPFSMEELIYRIEAILRRTSRDVNMDSQVVYQLGGTVFDSLKQTLTKDDIVTKLTTKENELLKLLCIYQNTVLERNFALKSIWVEDNYFNARSMDVYITKLRKHLKNETGAEIINVHGKGYKLTL
ncbi:MAG: response regulator transcription factor [Bacteroidales bacterium]